MKIVYRGCQLYLVIIAPLYSARIQFFNFIGIDSSHHDFLSVILAIIYVFSAILLFVLERVVRSEEVTKLKSRVSTLEAEKAARKPIIDDFKRRSDIELNKKELANEQIKLKLQKEKLEIEKEIREGNQNFEDASSLPSFQEEDTNES